MPPVGFAWQSCTWAPVLTQRQELTGGQVFPSHSSWVSHLMKASLLPWPKLHRSWSRDWAGVCNWWLEMRKRTCFSLGNFANFLMYLNRRGRLCRVILFLSCGEDTMCRSPYLLSCREKLPHQLHKNVHFLIDAHKIWGEMSNINSSQTQGASNPERVRNCSARGPVKSEESWFW